MVSSESGRNEAETPGFRCPKNQILLIQEEGHMKKRGRVFLALGSIIAVQMGLADWTPSQRLTWTSGASAVPQIAVDSIPIIHLVWPDYTPGNPEIFYRRSKDKGSTWTTKQRLTWTSEGALYAVITADSSGPIYMVWGSAPSDNSDLYFKTSTDAGGTWSSGQRFTWTSGYSYAPAIAVDSPDGLQVVWQDDTPGNSEIYTKKTSDAGATWSTNQRLTWNSGDSRLPDIAVDSLGHIHVVWYDDTPGNDEIYYKRSTDGGATWSTSRNLSLAVGACREPAVAIDPSGDIHLVWHSVTPGDWEIYYKRSTDGGATWSANQRITWSPGHSYAPSISSDTSGNLHIVWYDDKPGNYEVYYITSMDGGETWSASQRLCWTSGRSEYPIIAADASGNLHVFWDDDTPGNYEIYYKKNEL
jgi:hypothetical protein